MCKKGQLAGYICRLHIPNVSYIYRMKQLTTRQAFHQLISQRGIYKTLGIPEYTVRRYRLDIKNDIWPSLDRMEELLRKSGNYKIMQETLWNPLVDDTTSPKKISNSTFPNPKKNK
jgi:hypothetical protein